MPYLKKTLNHACDIHAVVARLFVPPRYLLSDAVENLVVFFSMVLRAMVQAFEVGSRVDTSYNSPS